MNDADFPVADVLRGIDAAERAGLGPIKVNMVVKRGTNDQRDPADGAPLPRPRRRAALHRVHGRRRDQRLAHGRGAAVGRGRRAHRRRVRARAAAGLGAAARPPSAGATPSRRRRRDRHDLERHPGVLPRLQPGAPVDRRQALPLPVRAAAATTCARCCAAAPATPRSPRRSASSGSSATTATPSCAARARRDARSGERRVEMHYIGG